MDNQAPAKHNDESSKEEQRLLVAMSPSLAAEQLVRWTHRLAHTLNCPWIAVYVETSSTLSEQDQLHLSQTFALARSLGAEVITTTDSDFERGLIRTALQHGVTQIVVGKPGVAFYRRLFRKDRWLDRLLQKSGNLDIHVVRFKEELPPKAIPVQAQPYGSSFQEYLIAVAVILAVAWALTFARSLLGYQVVAWIFLAVVVLMAAFVGRGATLLAALLSALLWNYLFEEPLYSLYIAGLENRILFMMYFLIAVVLGQLTAQIRSQERAERERQERAEAIQSLTRQITEATGFDDVLTRAIHQTMAVFKAQVALLLPSASERLAPHPADTFPVPENEHRIAGWVHEKGQTAGRFAINFPAASALYLPLAAYGEKLGVIALQLNQSFPPSLHQRNLLDAFSEQIALAIHRSQMHEVSEKAKVLAESERLSKTLLNSISHEFRTPLAVIQSATTYMVDVEKSDFSKTQKAMIAEIQEATARLNRLIGKVLEITRLESGHVKPKFEPCEVSDLIQMAEGETRQELAQHPLKIEIAPDLPAVPMDFELMLHALTNLLSNAAFHTPAGTPVVLRAQAEQGELRLVVADGGPGIPLESVAHVFEKFYRAPNARTGGTGLGLSLVKGFVEAQGGQVTAENRMAGGASFTIHLPLRRSLAQNV
jgi:two-component system sensor histidine kinase KdpD